MKRTADLAAILGAMLLLASGARSEAASVSESARELPMAYDVDVVIVGGSTGAAAAAVAAAERGAKVFLAAPRPYLGEDMCGTLRLWLEPGEEPTSPLAKELYRSAAAPTSVRKALPFSYQADLPSAARHRDTRKPSRLADGRWGRAASQSVQYDGDVTVTLDLGAERRFRSVHAFVFQRNNDFEVKEVGVSASSDKRNWKRIAVITNERLGRGTFETTALDLSTPVAVKARYVKLAFKRGPRAGRILLGEIVIEPDEDDKTDTGASRPSRPPPTPMQVKRTLDRALLDSGVGFLFGSYATDVLRDAGGRVAGIVMANRSGRQAVRAKVVIDATDRAWVARMAGASFRTYPSGPQTFRRVVVGGEPRTGEGVAGRRLGIRFTSGKRSYDVIEYTLTLRMKDGGFASFAAAEQLARDMTFHPAQVDASEVLFQVPPDPVQSRRSVRGEWPGADRVDLDAFRPAGVEGLYVLGGCADVTREAADRLLRPVELMDVGTRIGRASADEATRLPALRGVRLAGTPGAPVARGEVRETLVGIRPTQRGLPTIPSEKRAVPVLGEYDVVVIGGGTGGAPAGIGAARRGAKTLVVEYLHGLGGVGTLGLIGKYYHGYRGGFTAEHDKGVAALGASAHVIGKAEWWRRENRKAGADIWFGTLGCGALVERGRVKGVVVATPEGRGVVLAKVVIDSTGNADIAAAAGASCTYTDGSHVAVQGTGLPPRELGAKYTNTDYTFADDTDVTDAWHLFVWARQKFSGAYDLGQLIDTRERRRIVGEFTLSPLDMVNRRTFPDTVTLCKSNFDSHGYTVHPLFLVTPPDRRGMSVYVPYRCLVPKDLEGMLVTGLGASAHRDAMPVIRMQPDVQNQGYAAGVAAAMAARAGRGVRKIDIKALQKHLVQIGCLPASVLTDTDPYPLPKDRIVSAVRSVVGGYRGIAVILAQPEEAGPLLREAYRKAGSEKDRLVYAHILGVMGDPAGVEALVAKVNGSPRFDKGWNYRGMGQFGFSLSPLDNYIIALGRTRDRRALGPVLEKVKLLDASKEFSHHRAVAVALETLRARRAAGPLAELLGRPGMTGHHVTSMDEAGERYGRSPTETKPRNDSLRELVLARALYRCGDHNGIGERILRNYARDLRGHYARHAQAVLAGQ